MHSRIFLKASTVYLDASANIRANIRKYLRIFARCFVDEKCGKFPNVFFATNAHKINFVAISCPDREGVTVALETLL